MVAGDDGLTVVDVGIPGTDAALTEVAQAMGAPIVRVALTHAHPDHVGGLDALAADAEVFVAYATAHPELRFLLTPVGCGIAGYAPAEVAPLFRGVHDNVSVPASFVPFL